MLLTRNDAEHTATCNLTSKTSLETECFRPIRGGCDCALRSHSHTRRWLGGAYASTDMDMVLLLRSYYKNNYTTNRTHTQRRQQTFVDVESPVLPFSFTGVSHFHQPSPSSPRAVLLKLARLCVLFLRYADLSTLKESALKI